MFMWANGGRQRTEVTSLWFIKYSGESVANVEIYNIKVWILLICLTFCYVDRAIFNSFMERKEWIIFSVGSERTDGIL